MRKLPIYLGLLVAVAIVVELLWHTPLQKGGEAPPVVTTLTVVDGLSGRPLTDATVTRLLDTGADLGDPLPVGDRGTLRLAVGSPRLVRVVAPAYEGRVLAVGPGGDATVPLTPVAGDGLSLRVAGQVMAGRGYYAPRPGGGAPLLGTETDQVAHDRLLGSVAPVLRDADVTLAALGAPLVPEPYAAGEVPPGYRTDKPVVLASAPATAQALAGAGVDVVSLAGDHTMDALQPGLQSTLAALDAAGVAHFGAGSTDEEAWRPAYLEIRSQVVAFLGCTTFGGPESDAPSVATSTAGGVAWCSLARLRREVEAAAAQADVVVVSLDDAPWGEVTPGLLRAQTRVRRLAGVAAGAGASVVVGGYGHSTRGLRPIGAVPWLQGVGDLLYDKQVWAGLRSAVARVSFSGGRARSLTVDPIALVEDRPVPVVGSLAASLARRWSGTAASPLTLGQGAASWPALGDRTVRTLTSGAGTILPVGDAWSVDALGSGVLSGRDLLWGTGSMEDLDTDPDETGSTLWSLGKYVTTSQEAGCHGVQGLRLRRGPLSAKDVVISPRFRQRVTPGNRLTLTANVRLASAGASLEVRWYRTLDPTKRSSAADSVAIEQHRLSGPCSPVRLDLVVPEGMVAAQPYVRLTPRSDVNLAAELRVDDVQLISWDDPGTLGPRADLLGFVGSGEAIVSGTG